MQNLPPAELYSAIFPYMPWGGLINKVIAEVVKHTPQNGKVLDLICGPGYLLGNLKAVRPDITSLGVDLEDEYIAYAKKRYLGIRFETCDVRTWQTDELFDVVVCTGGVHHLPDADQEPFIARLKEFVVGDGMVIIADPYIDDFTTEKQRLLASSQLGYEYLLHTIKAGAPPPIIDAAVQILRNDVLLIEWKTSVLKRLEMFQKHFKEIECIKVWPQDQKQGFGDYYFILTSRLP